MKDKPVFITGEMADRGIVGFKFHIDDGEIYDRVKDAYEQRDYPSSQVFKLVPVKIRKQTKRKWEDEGIR